MDIKVIHKATLFSIEKILAKNQLKEIQVYKFDKWIAIKKKLESIRSMSDYFYALKLADEIIRETQKFCKEKGQLLYGDIRKRNRGD